MLGEAALSALLDELAALGGDALGQLAGEMAVMLNDGTGTQATTPLFE